MSDIKPIEFVGSSLDDLRSFPHAIRREAGHQLDLDLDLASKRYRDLIKELKND
jgi:phage-related protein